MTDASVEFGASLGVDPRPRASVRDGVVVLGGWRCRTCGRARAVAAPWCPACGGDLDPAEFGPGGIVWSSTVVHLDVSGLAAPYGLAYVDLDDGPRILAHVPGTDSPVPVGSRVTLVGSSERGDVEIAPTDLEAAP